MLNKIYNHIKNYIKEIRSLSTYLHLLFLFYHPNQQYFEGFQVVRPYIKNISRKLIGGYSERLPKIPNKTKQLKDYLHTFNICVSDRKIKENDR